MKKIPPALATLIPASAALHADIQYWNPTGTANVAGNADWDITVEAWSDTTANTTELAPWVNGNDAWFTLNTGANVLTVNGVTVGQMYFNNGPASPNIGYTLNPGTGPLILSGPVTNNSNHVRVFNTNVVLAEDQNWHLIGQILANGAITGGKSLHKSGPETLTISNAVNNLSGVWSEFGNVYFRGGGNAPGGAGSDLKLGGPLQPRSSMLRFDNMTDRGVTEWYAGDLVANGYGQFEVYRTPNNSTVSNILHFAGTLRRENHGVIYLNQYAGNGD
ncbi:MAG: hypothetical protein FWF96_08105, partial [Kiritimatiellaeota bacterium]|nr:hypothetical protein [Kiritimatiellota bacterium]